MQHRKNSVTVVGSAVPTHMVCPETGSENDNQKQANKQINKHRQNNHNHGWRLESNAHVKQPVFVLCLVHSISWFNHTDLTPLHCWNAALLESAGINFSAKSALF